MAKKKNQQSSKLFTPHTHPHYKLFTPTHPPHVSGIHESLRSFYEPVFGHAIGDNMLSILHSLEKRKIPSSVGPSNSRASRKKLSNTLVIVTCASLLTWLPFQILNTMVVFCTHSCSHPPLVVVCVFKFLQYSNSFVNVLTYPLRINGFRKSLFKLFKPWNKHHSNVHPIPIPIKIRSVKGWL